MGFARVIKPVKAHWPFHGIPVGFDTEFDSKKGELLSVQLWTGERGGFWPIKKNKDFSVNWLIDKAMMLHKGNVPRDGFLFISYFSLAELQWLPTLTEAIEVKEFARGSIDVKFHHSREGTIDAEVFDLCRWFDFASLKEAAKTIGMEKKEWDRKKITRADLKKPLFAEYALHDAKITYALFQELRAKFAEQGADIVRCRTAAATSATVFRLKHVKKEMFCDINAARRIALEGCWGGRAEAFGRGKFEDYAEVDLKSAYPNSALEIGIFPIQKSWRELSHVREISRFINGFATVRFRYPERENYPGLPVDTERALLFPREGVSTCTFPEIRNALDNGANIKLLEGWGYKTGTRAVADYLRWTLAERAKATGAGRMMYKLLGNSLCGKFAQRVDGDSIQNMLDFCEKEGHCFDQFSAMTKYERASLGYEPDDEIRVGAVFMPEWFALITGWTRAALAQLVRFGAVYCHTDSVWLPESQVSKLPKSPCGLSWEWKGAGDATVIRTRFGRLGEHIAFHSVWNRKAADRMLTKFKGEDFALRYPITRPLKFREAAKKKKQPGVWVTEWRQANTQWCNKRRLLKDGTTVPWKDSLEMNAFIEKAIAPEWDHPYIYSGDAKGEKV